MRMCSLLVASSIAVAAAGCSPRYDVFVTWTVDGFTGEDACQQLQDPSVAFRLKNRDSSDATVVEETATAPCADGQAVVKAGALSEIVMELLEGDDVYGSARPFSVTPTEEGTPGSAVELPVAVDLEIERGRLHSRLTVVGESCGDAGASEFSVTLSRETGPLGREILVEDEAVGCEDGEAFFDYGPVEVGSRYEVFASTSIAGVEYTTSDSTAGEGAVIQGALTDLVVDLDVVGRPAEGGGE
jgi:hypothetical protein